MKCTHCDGCCSCHLFPPCGFCIGHTECANCGQVLCYEKDTDEFGLGVCLSCRDHSDPAYAHPEPKK